MKNLRQIKGQQQAIEQLEAVLKSTNISHAYLFLGPKGTGKKTTAYAFAASLHCLDRGDDAAHCGHCLSCLKNEHGNHPDLYFTEPQGTSIKIDQIREIKALSAFKQLESKYKVIIINDAHKMTEEAANSLLKILEEPPSQTIFILTADSTYGLLTTIISRCQIVRFNLLASGVIQEILRDEFAVPEKEVYFLSQLAGGSVSQALKIRQQNAEGDQVDLLKKVLELIRQENYLELLNLSAQLGKSDELQVFLGFLLYWYRDLLIWAKTKELKLVQNQQLLLEEQHNYEDRESCSLIAQKAIMLVAQALKRLKQNANSRLTLDVLFLKLCTISKN
ncbi:DNA polymerase III subunit delta' [Bacillota bacterium LX-D]|nr:DNA polymerase III subunit delta' [Bacillota bacterium LX-D]